MKQRLDLAHRRAACAPACLLALALALPSSPGAAQGKAAPPPTPTAADEAPPLSPNCQAPLALTEEVTHLLTKAASHSTRSSACVDGPGTRVVVGEILVCPGRRTAKEITVEASYQVAIWAEGDTRMCGRFKPELPEDSETRPRQQYPDLCSHTPAVSRHRASFTFVRRGKKAFKLVIPEAIPGFTGPASSMTPLTQEHNGGCYGKSGPFKPAPVRPR